MKGGVERGHGHKDACFAEFIEDDGAGDAGGNGSFEVRGKVSELRSFRAVFSASAELMEAVGECAQSEFVPWQLSSVSFLSNERVRSVYWMNRKCI